MAAIGNADPVVQPRQTRIEAFLAAKRVDQESELTAVAFPASVLGGGQADPAQINRQKLSLRNRYDLIPHG